MNNTLLRLVFLNEEIPNTEHIVNVHVYDPESEDVIIRLLSQTENKSIFKTTNIASLFYKLGVANVTEKSLSNIHKQLDVVANRKSYRVEKQKKVLTFGDKTEPLENQNTDIPGVFISKNAIDNKKPEKQNLRHLQSALPIIEEYPIDLLPTDIKTFSLRLFPHGNLSTTHILKPESITTNLPLVDNNERPGRVEWDPHETHDNLTSNMQTEVVLVMVISLAGVTVILLSFFKTGKGIQNSVNPRYFPTGVIATSSNLGPKRE